MIQKRPLKFPSSTRGRIREIKRLLNVAILHVHVLTDHFIELAVIYFTYTTEYLVKGRLTENVQKYL